MKLNAQPRYLLPSQFDVFLAAKLFTRTTGFHSSWNINLDFHGVAWPWRWTLTNWSDVNVCYSRPVEPIHNFYLFCSSCHSTRSWWRRGASCWRGSGGNRSSYRSWTMRMRCWPPRRRTAPDWPRSWAVRRCGRRRPRRAACRKSGGPRSSLTSSRSRRNTRSVHRHANAR